MMNNKMWILLIVACAVIGGSRSQEIGPDLEEQGCGGIVHEIFGDGARVTVNGTRLVAHAWNPILGVYDTRVALYFQFVAVSEYRATQRACVAARDTLLRRQYLKDCQCSVETIAEESPGYKEGGYRHILTGCPDPLPNFVASSLTTISNATKTTWYNETMPGSTVDSFAYENPAGGLKVGITMQNWTWVPDTISQNRSYLASALQVGLYSDFPFEIGQTLSESFYTMNAIMGPYIFRFKLDLGYILDGNAVVTQNPKAVFPLSNPEGTGGEIITFPMETVFCEPIPAPPGLVLQKWTDILYDPSLVVIFNGYETPTAGDPPTNPKTSSAWIIAVSVALPLVAIAIVAVILVVLFVPAARQLVRPFARSQGDSPAPSDSNPSSNTSPKGNGWKKADKPQ